MTVPIGNGVPAWAVGWDSGIISAVALAIRQPHVIQGLVLASAITQAVGLSSDWGKRHPQGVASMAVEINWLACASSAGR